MNRLFVSAKFSILCFVFATASMSACASDAPAPAAFASAGAAKPDEKPPEAKVFVCKHQITVGATNIACTATAGTMLMKNDKHEPIALFGFTAWGRDGGE